MPLAQLLLHFDTSGVKKRGGMEKRPSTAKDAEGRHFPGEELPEEIIPYEPPKIEFKFRRFLILLVSVLGGLYLAFRYVPRLTGFIFVETVGIFVLSMVIVALRKGYVTINAQSKIVTYTRSDNPLAFCFYIVFFTILGILACCVAFCFLPGKFNIFRAYLPLMSM